MRLSRLAPLAAALLLSGCPAVTSDPPPPARPPEIAVAPPHALGAMAGGTDAAPHPDATPGGEVVEPDVPPSAAPDGAIPVPTPGAAAPPAAPDAGMAL